MEAIARLSRTDSSFDIFANMQNTKLTPPRALGGVGVSHLSGYISFGYHSTVLAGASGAGCTAARVRRAGTRRRCDDGVEVGAGGAVTDPRGRPAAVTRPPPVLDLAADGSEVAGTVRRSSRPSR
jgi:hypothetical protein